MTKIEFYFDPSCPFSWVTSRWLTQVNKEREIDITWRQFSLALKNDELEEKEGDTKHAISHRASHRVHRIIYKAVQENGASTLELYSEFGIRNHIMEEVFDDVVIAKVLEDKKLPAELIKAADDTSIDVALQAEIDSAVEVTGKDIGVPTIVFTNDEGERLGYFGPVLNELPDMHESLQIWDGLEKLATVSAFYELKRNRPGGPNVFSAARC